MRRAPPLNLTALLQLTELADYTVAFALRTAAELGIADHLSGGPKPVEELARLTGTHADALARLLRCLARNGVFAETADRNFGVTPIAELLASAHPLSLRGAFPLVAEDLMAWSRVDWSLRTGQPAFAMVHGRAYWDYLTDHPDASRRMDESLESANRLIYRMFSRLYDWNEIGCLVDVGGGNGAFLVRLLADNTQMCGIVFDRPHVVEQAQRVLDEAGVASRCRLVGGDFFERVPVEGDAYLLKTILHDWEDDAAATILRAIRLAMPTHGRLLVIEALLGSGNGYDIGKLLDLNSFVLAGGVDRSVEQFEGLFRATGFRLLRTLRTTNALALLEAVPVSR